MTSKPRKKIEDVSVLTVFTLVVWVTCLTIGIIGLVTGETGPPPATQPAAMETVAVQVLDEAQPIPPTVAPMETAALPKAPPLPAVALPSLAIAFELPMEGPAVLVTAVAAAPVTSAPAATTNQAIWLKPGAGEGFRPQPVYPEDARLASQQGTVEVYFTVDTQGSVTSARVYLSSWPSLNQAALSAVRETWKMPPGPARAYIAPIQFQLH